jgi:hypothetical protein
MVRDDLVESAEESRLRSLIANTVKKETWKCLCQLTRLFCVLFWRKEDAEVVMWGRPADPSPSLTLKASRYVSLFLPHPHNAQLSLPTPAQRVAELQIRR